MSKHDFCIWHLTLTFDLHPNLAKVKVNLHTEYQGSAVRAVTDGRTDGQTLPSTLSPCFAVDNYGTLSEAGMRKVHQCPKPYHYWSVWMQVNKQWILGHVQTLPL